MPPTRVLIRGSPASSASWATNARASQLEVSNAMSAAANRSEMSSRRPRSRTGNAAAATRCSSLARSGPSPTMKKWTAGGFGGSFGDVEHHVEVLLRCQPADGEDHQVRVPHREASTELTAIGARRCQGGAATGPSRASGAPSRTASASRSLLAARVRSAIRATPACSNRPATAEAPVPSTALCQADDERRGSALRRGRRPARLPCNRARGRRRRR